MSRSVKKQPWIFSTEGKEAHTGDSFSSSVETSVLGRRAPPWERIKENRMGADSSLVEVAGPERLGLRTGTEVATETSAGVRAWWGMWPTPGFPVALSDPVHSGQSFRAPAAAGNQRPLPNGHSRSFMKGLWQMWAEGGKPQNLGLSGADPPQAAVERRGLHPGRQDPGLWASGDMS